MQTKSDLLWLGWDEALDSHQHPGEIVARVVGEERGSYRILFAPNIEATAIIIGKFRHQANARKDYPAVGDWISCEKPSGSENWVIQRLLPRRSCLSRKVAGDTTGEQIIASNIDYVMIAMSCNQNFNISRVERYLTLAWNSGATPIVLLTKSDITDSPEEYIEQLKSVSADTEYLLISSHKNTGLDELKQYFLPNKTNVIVGSSGVGKSTLINSLLGENKLKTQDIRDVDGKGKHTTTSRYLLHLPFGGMIIDTPGMREVQVLDVEEGMDAQFADIDDLTLKCKFSDCGHHTEPGCAIKMAIKSGELDLQHWESFLKLKDEVKEIAKRAEKKTAAGRNKSKNNNSKESYEKNKKK